MGSSKAVKKEIEFEAVIAPSGGVTYEYDSNDEVDVRAVIGRMESGAQQADADLKDKPRPPRLLPRHDEILTPQETADHLGIPKKTVIFLCAEGRLEGSFKAGRRWRIPGRAIRKMAGMP